MPLYLINSGLYTMILDKKNLYCKKAGMTVLASTYRYK